MNSNLRTLLENGVSITDPESVFVDESVILENISAGTIIHPGCRIYGASTSIGPKCEIGAEGPVTLRDCQLDANVKIRGGFAERATFMDGADCGEGTHIRPGSILEEYASIAHTDGLKQTILMPFVTLGSLINFCDVLMAGGTSTSNHSEVGSSYIHFNFTPHQDKATPSIMGDVQSGVLLDSPPIFLGGQGGMVGPRRVAFGTVIGAGSILRSDIDEPETLVCVPSGINRPSGLKYNSSAFGDIRVIVRNNFNYIGNLLALLAWYKHCRSVINGVTEYGTRCIEGGIRRIGEGLDERIKQLAKFAGKLSTAVDIALKDGADAANNPLKAQISFSAQWCKLELILMSLREKDFAPPDSVMNAISRISAKDGSYVTKIKSLRNDEKQSIKKWLSSIVEEASSIYRE